MTTSIYELRSPTSAGEWSQYHAIRRRVLFDARGSTDAYNPEHPDEGRPENHPKLLLHNGDPVGVIRIDLSPPRAHFRRVAIREDLQRRGHGRSLLALAESFAMANGCTEVVSFVDPGAIGFYASCGFAILDTASPQGLSVPMAKPLSPSSAPEGAS